MMPRMVSKPPALRGRLRSLPVFVRATIFCTFLFVLPTIFKILEGGGQIPDSAYWHGIAKLIVVFSLIGSIFGYAFKFINWLITRNAER